MTMCLALCSSPPNWALGNSRAGAKSKQQQQLQLNSLSKRRRLSVKACPFNTPDEPILREALKEPVAFMGGMFAGLLRLDLNEDPLKEWVTRTIESSGISAEEIDSRDAKFEEEIPQQIEIE